MADTTYRNLNPKYDDTRYKVNNAIIRMMNANPTMGLGYLIGNAIGENYFEKKRAKTSQEANDNVMNGIGADEKNGVTGVPSSAGNRGNDYYSSMNKAFDEYRNGSNGKVLYEGRNNNAPRTPQQNNTSGVTVGNVDNGGGVSSVADAWNKMANGSGYNPGNTTMFTNGTRDLGNVIGADANGEFGRMAGLHPGVIIDTARGIYPAARPGTYIDTSRGIYMDSSQNTPAGGSAPSAANFPQKPANGPAPYTDDQLRQIQGQNFSAEELAKMASPDELARMVVMMRGGAPAAQAPEQVAAASSGGYAPTNASPASSGIAAVMNNAANETPAATAPIVADAVPNASDLRIHGNTGQGGGGQAWGPVPEYVDPAPNVPVVNDPYAGYGYGVNAESDFNNGGLFNQIAEYVRQKNFGSNGSF